MSSKSIIQELQRYVLFLFSILLFLASTSPADDNISEKHIHVVMRKIGHEILQCLGDKTSRVLPIEKRNQSYKISFEVDLSFDPDDIVSTINHVIKEEKISSHYFVEVEQCETQIIMHSYEIKQVGYPQQIACTGRILPSDCYDLLITLVSNTTLTNKKTENSSRHLSSDLIPKYILILLGLILFIRFLWQGKLYFFPNKERLSKSHLISIGALQFDQINMVLYSDNNKIKLTNKETELLSLLNEFANSTVKRELILQRVWGDNGDYVGRTLDVSISKLRKKIDADSNIKLLNVRGVGYRLVLNNVAT